MRRRIGLLIAVMASWALMAGSCGKNNTGSPGSDGGDGDSTVVNTDGDVTDGAAVDSGPTTCVGGIDLDGDGYGPGCPAGPDCDDANPLIHPGAPELCNGLDDNCNAEVDEGVLTACGNCSTACSTDSIGAGPFPMPEDSSFVDADGVGLDANGDLVLDQSSADGNYIWIANENDWGRGSVSKVDSASMMETARYWTVTCDSNPATPECDDVDDVDPGFGVGYNIPFGSTLINPLQNNRPSRTAMDYNGDVWVANRAFGLQASVTKIANDESDCIDRNGNNRIDTSRDLNGDGFITTDCDGNGVPDDINTVCTLLNLTEPEFLGLDDECVLFTTNVGVNNDVARAITLDGGDPYSGGAGNAWVPLHMRTNGNILLKIDGASGEIFGGWQMPPEMNAYGAAVDGHGILWMTDYPWDAVYLLYFDTNTETMGSLIPNGYWNDPLCQDVAGNGSRTANHYGMGLDSENNVWLGGWNCGAVFRYRPDRTSFSTLSQGSWTRVRFGMGYMRGIAADKREVGGIQHHNFIWSAVNSYGGLGYVARVPQWILDGDYDCASLPECDTFPLTGDGVIGCGVAFDGNIWGISHSGSHATRLLVDANGDVLNDPPYRNTTDIYDLTDDAVQVGTNPYTYSDFTGFGLKTFTRPRGTYRYIMEGCAAPSESNWRFVEWNSTEPAGTSILVRVRTSENGVTWGDWFGPWDQSPATLFEPPGPLILNPALYLQVEFELSTQDSAETPILHDFDIIWQCDAPVG